MFIKIWNLDDGYLNIKHVVLFERIYTWRKKNDHGYSWRLFTNLGFMSPYRVITVHDQDEVTKINSYLVKMEKITMRNYSSDKDKSKLFNEFCKLPEKRQKHMFAAIYGHMEDLERKVPEYISSGFFQGVESIINRYNSIDN